MRTVVIHVIILQYTQIYCSAAVAPNSVHLNIMVIYYLATAMRGGTTTEARSFVKYDFAGRIENQIGYPSQVSRLMISHIFRHW